MCGAAPTAHLASESDPKHNLNQLYSAVKALLELRTGRDDRGEH
ncbi:hypothetical protein Pd630_LPD17026 (plasmid) [Rhodococcus opacus PD630]|nr:hypothetical protein Pd630_LPD17026 [Rhodococcus opacus PD630]